MAKFSATQISILVVVILLAIGAGYWKVFGGRSASSQSPSGTPVPQIIVKRCAQDTRVCPNGQVVGREGERCEFATCPQTTVKTTGKETTLSFEDRFHRYRFSYPSSFTQTVENQGAIVRIANVTASDKKGTVITDGMVLFVEALPIQSQTLDQFADSLITKLVPDKEESVKQTKTMAKIGNAAGVSFTISHNGSFTHYLLQKNTSSSTVVHVTVEVEDPKQHGYQDTANAILETLQVVQ